MEKEIELTFQAKEFQRQLGSVVAISVILKASEDCSAQLTSELKCYVTLFLSLSNDMLNLQSKIFDLGVEVDVITSQQITQRGARRFSNGQDRNSSLIKTPQTV